MIEAVGGRGIDSEAAMIAAGFGMDPFIAAKLRSRKVGLQIVAKGNDGALRHRGWSGFKNVHGAAPVDQGQDD
jgi:hypothetical protein